jgi:hypothetical protein
MPLQSRRWCLTIFSAEPVWDSLLCNYLIGSKEIAPGTGRVHWQYYVEFRTKQRLNAVKKTFPGAHAEIAKGTLEDNQIYCTKDSVDVQECGIPMSQGARTDLMDAAARVQAGERADDVINENPMIGHQYGRTLDRLEAIRLNQCRRRPGVRSVIVLWGRTGIGKSRWWNDRFPDAYVKPNGDYWTDYRGEKVVVFDEYDKNPDRVKEIGNLLQWTDRYPRCPINWKYGGGYLQAIKFIFTSTLHYSEWWDIPNKEAIVAQFARRVTMELDEDALAALYP